MGCLHDLANVQQTFLSDGGPLQTSRSLG